MPDLPTQDTNSSKDDRKLMESLEMVCNFGEMSIQSAKLYDEHRKHPYPEVLYSNKDAYETNLYADQQYLYSIYEKFAGKERDKIPLSDLKLAERELTSRIDLISQKTKEVDISIHWFLDRATNMSNADSCHLHAVTASLVQILQYQIALFQRYMLFDFLLSDVIHVIYEKENLHSSKNRGEPAFPLLEDIKEFIDNLVVSVSEILNSNQFNERVTDIVCSLWSSKTDIICAHKEIDAIRAEKIDAWFTI